MDERRKEIDTKKYLTETRYRTETDSLRLYLNLLKTAKSKLKPEYKINLYGIYKEGGTRSQNINDINKCDSLIVSEILQCENLPDGTVLNINMQFNSPTITNLMPVLIALTSVKCVAQNLKVNLIVPENTMYMTLKCNLRVELDYLSRFRGGLPEGIQIISNSVIFDCQLKKLTNLQQKLEISTKELEDAIRASDSLTNPDGTDFDKTSEHYDKFNSNFSKDETFTKDTSFEMQKFADELSAETKSVTLELYKGSKIKENRIESELPGLTRENNLQMSIVNRILLHKHAPQDIKLTINLRPRFYVEEFQSCPQETPIIEILGSLKEYSDAHKKGKVEVFFNFIEVVEDLQENEKNLIKILIENLKSKWASDDVSEINEPGKPKSSELYKGNIIFNSNSDECNLFFDNCLGQEKFRKRQYGVDRPKPNYFFLFKAIYSAIEIVSENLSKYYYIFIPMVIAVAMLSVGLATGNKNLIFGGVGVALGGIFATAKQNDKVPNDKKIDPTLSSGSSKS